jgi:hypothetical protein
MSQETKWYVVHTYSGYENKVKEDLIKAVENAGLSDTILEVMYPTEETIEILPTGKRKSVTRKVYPGYVMVKMVVDVVEKERPAFARTHKPRAFLARTGERPLAMPLQNALGKSPGNRTAIQCDKGAARPLAVLVDKAGRHLLPRTGFPEQKDRDVGIRRNPQHGFVSIHIASTLYTLFSHRHRQKPRLFYTIGNFFT